ncbi:hypothetical protein N7519_004046 [Penicillium mononematosum]|uniref:uncharacterized protein n=1 Tax=Penicillium mononematosum TaxID=268346 RepID=UPI002549B4C6|nr:uncharacterized protein N7519_004046 [Penicillium mononematosum]KAJ6189138.1 hypothetical protein N7519_004046 [Penicillium mononematosum]
MRVVFHSENWTPSEFQPVESVTPGMEERDENASASEMIRKQNNQIIKQSTEKLGDRGNTARGRNTKSIPSPVTTQVLLRPRYLKKKDAVQIQKMGREEKQDLDQL